MGESEILIGLIEIAIGITGFSGIVFALSPPEKRSNDSLNALTNMACNAIVVIIQCFIAIFLVGMIEESWGWASTVSFAISLASLPVFFSVIPKAFGKLDIPFPLAAATLSISFGQLFIHAANTPFFGIESFYVFFIAESCLLVTSLLIFLYLIIQLGSSDEST